MFLLAGFSPLVLSQSKSSKSTGKIAMAVPTPGDPEPPEPPEPPQNPSTSTFGFNYWPHGYHCDALNNNNWTTVRPIVAADLDHMASLSGGVIRIMFWPQVSGFLIEGNNGGGRFTNEFYEQKTNVVDFIRLAHERDIKVIVAFGNNYFDSGTSAGHRWWMDAYGNSPAGFTNFLNDTRIWMNGFVDSIEASPYKSAVIFYDYQNEYYRVHPYMGWYLTYLYDWSNVPAGKRGVSVLQVPEDVNDLQYQLSVGTGPQQGSRHLEYVDFHSYPAFPANPNIEGSYDYVKSKFPNSIVLLGEFGRTALNQSEEQAQQSTVLDVATRARNKGIPYYLNWMLWDNNACLTSNACPSFGYNPNSPRDVLGGMSSLLNIVQNPDMELRNGSTPANWMAAGSIPISFYSGGPSYGDAATNQWYARIRVDQSSGGAWLSSYLTPVTGGNRVFANAFIRSSMDNVTMSIVEYDQNGNGITYSSGPSFNPVGWSFNNYLQRVGSWSVTLTPNTRYIIVNISATARPGTSSSNPGYLDVDAVSTWERP